MQAQPLALGTLGKPGLAPHKEGAVWLEGVLELFLELTVPMEEVFGWGEINHFRFRRGHCQVRVSDSHSNPK